MKSDQTVYLPTLCGISLAVALLMSGCGGGDSGASATPAPAPPVAPAGDGVSALSGKPTEPDVSVPAAKDPAAMGAVSEADAKAQADDLAARIKAGEEGTTPDPVEDRGLMILESAVDSYYNSFQRAPSSLQELVTARYLRAVPAAPAGKKYVITPEGQVKMENAK